MKDTIIKDAEEMGISVTDEAAEKLVLYRDLLLEWNKKMNLTAITDDEGILKKHFLDSISVLTVGETGENVADIGTGAGFPGMVLKIIRPEIKLTLIDSLNKRLTFLRAVAENVGADGVTFVHERAEDAAHMALYREKYDTVVTRALADMTTLASWCLPFVRVGGRLLAMKGPDAESEAKAALRTINTAGGEISQICRVSIPDSDMRHCIAVINKIRPTPQRYPLSIHKRKKGI